MNRAWLGLALLLAYVSNAGATLDVDLARYRDAPTSGSVAGRVYEERRRPASPDVGIAGAVIAMVPRSAAVVERLARIKEGSRVSLRRHEETIPALRRAWESYQERLVAADGATFVRSATSDDAGHFRILGLPRGDWLLLGWRTVTTTDASAGGSKFDRRTFNLKPTPGGYRTVEVWLRELEVDDGSVTLQLTDRNVWLSGVEEQRR
jgi:hypothetical protein